MPLIKASEILKKLLDGNKNYSHQHAISYFDQFKSHQAPEVTLLTCSDSRVQVTIFGLDVINEIFVVRNIGNQILSSFGSVDYGVLHLKTPLLIIMGHSHCGAIDAYFKDYRDEPFDIIRELDHLSIPIGHFRYDQADHEKAWTEAVERNVDYQVDLAIKRYSDRIEKGELYVLGMVDDFLGVYGVGEGRLIVINLNGEKQEEKIKSSNLFSELPASLKMANIRRFTES
jgi:carbonic anhydrase